MPPESLQVGVEDEVHDAGYGVSTVGGRCPARYGFDRLQQGFRKRADIGAAESRRGHDPPPVEQHERPLRADTAQVKVSRSGAREETAGIVRRSIVVEQRQLAQRLDHVAGRHEIDVLAADDRHRRRRVHARCLLDARTRYRDFLELCVLCEAGRVAEPERGQAGIGEWCENRRASSLRNMVRNR